MTQSSVTQPNGSSGENGAALPLPLPGHTSPPPPASLDGLQQQQQQQLTLPAVGSQPQLAGLAQGALLLLLGRRKGRRGWPLAL